MSKLNEGALAKVSKKVSRLLFRMITPFWKLRLHSFSLAILTFLSSLAASTIVSATDPEDRANEEVSRSEETVSGLPSWEEGDFGESFDVRIWPERIVMWLEQENLKDLIADPLTPAPEREALKRVLAMQQVWPKRI
jgi:hypothetical protein